MYLFAFIYLYQYTKSKACKYLCLCDIFDRVRPYTTPTSTATLSSAHQIWENSDRQQPQSRPASCGCGCWSPYTGNLVEVAVGNCGCGWKLLSCMGPCKNIIRQHTKEESIHWTITPPSTLPWLQSVHGLLTACVHS